MLRQIMGYLPSVAVPAIISFCMVYAYTRLLPPSSFGLFNLAFLAAQLIQTTFFFAVPMALSRFYPEAVSMNRQGQFLKACYVLFYAMGAIVIVLVTAANFLPLPLSPTLRGLVIALMLGRSAVVLNQSVNRISFRIGRYSFIECLHALLGLGFGLAFITLWGPAPWAPLLGLTVAATVCVLADGSHLLLPFRRDVGKVEMHMLKRLLAFAAPQIAVDVTVCLLQLSDRFLLDGLAGAAALGVYAVAYALVERPITLICVAVTTATYPTAVQVTHDSGSAAGGRQLGDNGAILFALVLPGCVGIALLAPYMSAVLIGPEYRSAAVILIPILCVSALFRGLSTHFIDHIFHLSTRLGLAVWLYGPAAAVNIILNLFLVPRYGAVGAAWAGVVAQSAAFAAGLLVGRRVYPVRFPITEVIRVMCATLIMAVALAYVTFPLTWVGMLMAVALGAAVFGAAAFALDLGHMRTMAPHRMRRLATARTAEKFGVSRL